MKRFRLLPYTICLFLPLSYFQLLAANQESQSADEAALRLVIEELATAWATGDAKAFASHFASDADFVIVNGTHHKGKDAIEQNHAFIFNSFFKGTKNRIVVESIRFIQDDIAAVHVNGTVVKQDESYPELPAARLLYLFERTDAGWEIALAQNTPIRRD